MTTPSLSRKTLILYGMVFFSGFAGLVYQVLWMKQLGLLFGNTSQAAAATFAAFFAGLAAGSWGWGRNAARMKHPLRRYGWLEVGIALSALLYFAILALYYRIYPEFYQRVNSATLLLVLKFALALLLIFPPAFFMGGTIPVMAQYLIRNRSSFGSASAFLYGINTLGAAIGVFMAGFWFPLWLGFRLTYGLAMTVTCSMAVGAFVLSRPAGSWQPDDQPAVTPNPAGAGWGRLPLLVICFLSGFGTLALEVLWTRMFVQVLENSVYTFAAILLVVLLCLAGGSFISSRLARLSVRPSTMIPILLLAGGLSIAISPFVFMELTDSLQILVSPGSWFSYLGLIFKNVFLTIAVPTLILGTIFPYLLKAEETYSTAVGRSIGILSCVNTIGAILGSLVCGFWFLGNLGMWRTMHLMALVYLVAVLLFPNGWRIPSLIVRGAALSAMVLLFWGLDPRALPVHSIDKLRPSETILETWEGRDCIVSAARTRHGISIKINSHYGLGSTDAYMQERMQSDIPLYAYPETRNVFFLGMGTGITAGGALDAARFPKINRVVTCELVPEVIQAARQYITDVDGFDCTGGLFTDPRATLLAEDGRHYLMATREAFDMINADLFVPFQAGTGSLYSKEHFESVKHRLAPGGVFFQWLPLYQLTENEVYIIARTMLEVFDQVSLWRNNFQPGDEVIAFAGHKLAAPLPSNRVDSHPDRTAAVAGKNWHDLMRLALPFDASTILFFYGGNITAARELFEGYPVNTDDKPLIEYMAPRTYRDRKDTAIPWFVGPRIAKLVDNVQRLCPPASDPLLAERLPAERRLPVAGSYFHWARIWDVIGDEAQCHQAWTNFIREWTDAPKTAADDERPKP